MLMTESPVSSILSSQLENSASTMVAGGEKKKGKTVGFAEDVATEVAYIDLGKPSRVWYSKSELKMFREKAKDLSDHLQESQPALAREIEEAYEFTRHHKQEGSDRLFAKWHKLSSSRRGLERFVLSKEKRQEQANQVKASRGVVLNLQCLFQRSPGGAQPEHAELMQQQYSAFCTPAHALARIYAAHDEAAVRPYHQDQDDSESDALEAAIMDNDDLLSVGSGSISSRDSRKSRSAKKVKRRPDCSTDSSSIKKKSSKKKSSGKQLRSKSPGRRIRSFSGDHQFTVSVVNSVSA